MSQISPGEIRSLVNIFPNLKHLLLSNFHRCKRPHEHDDRRPDSDEVHPFAEKTFQPAAREYVEALDLYSDFKHLQQIVFRSAEAELGVRFRRQSGPGTEQDAQGWHEELLRLY